MRQPPGLLLGGKEVSALENTCVVVVVVMVGSGTNKAQ